MGKEGWLLDSGLLFEFVVLLGFWLRLDLMFEEELELICRFLSFSIGSGGELLLYELFRLVL